MDTVMARFVNDGSFEKQLKESSLIQLYALHDFFVMAGNHDRQKRVDEEITRRIEKSNG
jgi:hypothetical protein